MDKIKEVDTIPTLAQSAPENMDEWKCPWIKVNGRLLNTKDYIHKKEYYNNLPIVSEYLEEVIKSSKLNIQKVSSFMGNNEDLQDG